MIDRQDFADGEALAEALAKAVAADLKAGIAKSGKASLAVSGGSTPKRFFQILGAHKDIDWQKVTVTLVDERWVDENSDRSNARLVRLHLLQGPAAAASFVPLYMGEDEPTMRLIEETRRQQGMVPHPFDAVILGMGTDGHTASFFPGADNLEQALTDEGPALAISAPGADEARVTLTLPYLLATKALYLHIEGAAKADTLADALEDGPVADMPVRAVLRQSAKPVNIYWCP